MHCLPEFAQTHAHQVADATQPSHPLLPPSLPALSLSQHQGLFLRVVLPFPKAALIPMSKPREAGQVSLFS